jgi:DNA-binding phage protein
MDTNDSRPTSIHFHEALADDLSDPEFAAGYLEGCLEDGPDVFLVALGDVVKASGMIPS